MAELIAQFSGREDLPERDPNEHYETKLDDAKIMTEMLLMYYRHEYILPDAYKHYRPAMLDIGADTGVWGTAVARVTAEKDAQWYSSGRFWVGGVELRDLPRPNVDWYNDDRYCHFPYHDWVIGDATDPAVLDQIDNDEIGHYAIAFGNPPFLKSKKPGEKMTQFLQMLKERFPVCGFLLQTNYLSSDQRYQALFQEGLAVVAQSIGRIHFEGRGNQQYREYAFYIWDQAYPKDQLPQLTWFDSSKKFIDPRFIQKYGG